MKVFTSLRAFTPGSRPAAVAIGNFDGLHRGHHRILERLCRLAREKGLCSLVLTFHPHPEKVFGQTKMLMLQTLDERLAAFERIGVERVMVTSFSRRFAGLSAEQFVRRILVRTLQAKAVVVGRDFRFGQDRRGDIRTLKTLGRKFGLSVHAVAPVVHKGRVVSSSSIRRLVEGGKVEEASRYLGRPFAVSGLVVRGNSLGRSLGFPTANIRTANEILPRGVYITLTRVGSSLKPSLTSIGTRPTFGPSGKVWVETYIIDYFGSLYGRPLEILFLKKIRDQVKFSGPAGLVLQMIKDEEAARKHFQRHRARRGPFAPRFAC